MPSQYTPQRAVPLFSNLISRLRVWIPLFVVKYFDIIMSLMKGKVFIQDNKKTLTSCFKQVWVKLSMSLITTAGSFSFLNLVKSWETSLPRI